MSTINSLTSNGYYSLNNQSSSNSAATDSISQLQQALSTAQTTGQPADTSYLLNLSAEAQAYIQSLATGNDMASTSNATASGSNAGSTDTFTLTRAQQKTVDSIIAKYKDAPYNEDTFDAMQKDLDDAGLSATTLGAQDKVRSFNPTKFLLDALNGTSSDDGSAFDALTGKSSGDEQTDISNKYYNFMSGVADRWKAISTTAGQATDDQGQVSADV